MSAPDSITVTVADHNGVAVLSIGGEIDLITAAALEEAIGEVVADNPTALVIDLSAVEFLGSVGLKILAATSEKIGQSVKFGVVARGSVTRRHPHEFRPERFLGTRPQTYAWVPFGGGVKRCLGANFSMRELITVLHVLLREGEFTAVDDEPERIVRRSIMLVPRRGTRVRFRPAR